MILYPAIDLKDGECVRVLRGDLATATVFNTSPTDQAAVWARAGFRWLHVVDLDGSVEGRSVNRAAVQAILATTHLPVQLGGGVRSMADIEKWIDRGVRRVILGTAAAENPDLVRAASRRWPGRIAVSIDVRGGRVAVSGWTRETALTPVEVARRYENDGVGTIVVTDIDRDGAMIGFNVELFGEVADAVATPVIAAGGLARVDDIVRLRRRAGAPIAGAVLGRALYAGAIPADEALTAAA